MKQGFEAKYVIYDCPWNCSQRGVCINNTCRCHAGYHGDACQHQSCMDGCRYAEGIFSAGIEIKNP